MNFDQSCQFCHSYVYPIVQKWFQKTLRLPDSFHFSCGNNYVLRDQDFLCLFGKLYLKHEHHLYVITFKFWRLFLCSEFFCKWGGVLNCDLCDIIHSLSSVTQFHLTKRFILVMEKCQKKLFYLGFISLFEPYLNQAIFNLILLYNG